MTTASFFKKAAMQAVVVCLVCLCSCSATNTGVQSRAPKFKVVAFYTATPDPGHISFLREAAVWFPKMARQYNFTYDTSTNLSDLDTSFLAQYQVVIFLDCKPNTPARRDAFKSYMENGGGWMGFHASAFGTNRTAPDWYHDEFLGSGAFRNNSWRPTSAVLRVEDRNHPATRHLPETFKSAPTEWYGWRNDLRTNSDIRVLLSIDPSSFPVGTGPRPGALWQGGDFPVVWTNKRYKMIYLNMGHNDVDDINNTLKDWSATFSSESENRLIIDGLFWLGTGRKM